MKLESSPDRLDEILKSVHELARQSVMVGVPAATAQRDDGPITNADLGYIHEFGAPAANIPARPFLAPGIASALPDVEKALHLAAGAAMDDKPERIDPALHQAGLIAATGAKTRLNDGPHVPLAETTIHQRQNRRIAPRMGTQPLIDTGALRNSITYVIRKD